MTKNVVIIDDDEDTRRSLRRTLEIAGGYQVHTASNGKDGLKLVRKKGPDLILLDVMMPGLDGFEVLKRLKQNHRTMSIPVVMLSAKTSQRAKALGAKLYTDLYLTKPITPDILLEKINDVFRRRRIV